MQRLGHILSRPYVWMPAVICIAFWQVASCRYSMQWDMTDQAFVWHRYISECFHAHILPLWAPYSKWGYPMYADPQSGLFYPVVWLFALAGRYTLYSNDLELFVHIVLAAFGMKYLLETLSVSRRTAAIFGLVYAMSGPVVGHASHITLIGSLCWMPYLFASYIRFVTGYRLQHLLLVALFVFLQLTGGYPGATIIMIYVLVILFTYHFIAAVLSHKAALGRTGGMHALLILAIVIVSAGFLYAVAMGQPYIDRGEGVTRTTAGHVPFSPVSLITAIYPGAVGDSRINFGTDITMQDIYIGILPLALMLTVVLVRRRLSSYLIFAGSIFWLLAAMGDHTPVRGWLYDLLPGMKLFRHAGIFRLFTCMGFVVLAARGFDILDSTDSVRYKLVLKYLLTTGLVLISSVAIYTACVKPATPLTSLLHSLQRQNALHIILLLSWLLLMLTDRYAWHTRRNVLCLLILAEMLVSVQADIHKTVVSSRRVDALQAHLDRYPQGFPMPANASILSCNQWNDSTIGPPVWHNAGFIRKQLSYEGDNRFNLKTYAELYARPDFYRRYEQQHLVTADTGAVITMTGFDPRHFSFDVSGDKAQSVTLAQMYFPGWEAKVDSKAAPVAQSDDHFVSCAIGAGTHHVELYFTPQGPALAFFYTVGVLLLLLPAIAIVRRRIS